MGLIREAVPDQTADYSIFFPYAELVRLLHEYVDDLSELDAALGEARALVQELHAAFLAISAYASARLRLDS